MVNKFITLVVVWTCSFLVGREGTSYIIDRYVPVAEPKECLLVKFSNTQSCKLMVVSNKKEGSYSETLRFLDKKTSYAYDVSWKELRKLNAKRISCHE